MISVIWWEDASYGGSKATRVPIPKVNINGKINTRMGKKTLKMWEMPYMWVQFELFIYIIGNSIGIVFELVNPSIIQ